MFRIFLGGWWCDRYTKTQNFAREGDKNVLKTVLESLRYGGRVTPRYYSKMDETSKNDTSKLTSQITENCGDDPK